MGTRGKAPNIGVRRCDIDNAVKGAITGIFYGRVKFCNAGSRLFLESKVKDEFTEKLVARAAKMRPDDPLDPKTRAGRHRQPGADAEPWLGYIDAARKMAKLVAAAIVSQSMW